MYNNNKRQTKTMTSFIKPQVNKKKKKIKLKEFKIKEVKRIKKSTGFKKKFSLV